MPLMMVVCDGFLLAWVLTELRNAGFDDAGEDRFHPAQALELMPAASLGCALALPARYVATLVFLALQHLPTSVGTTAPGPIHPLAIRLGPGRSSGCLAGRHRPGGSRGMEPRLDQRGSGGFKRLLRIPGGTSRRRARAWPERAAASLAGLAYSVVFLLPPAGWVLPAADSYAHYVDTARRALDACRLDRAG